MPTSDSDCWMKGGEQGNILAPGRGQQPHRKPLATGASLIAGLIQQLDRARLVVGVLRAIVAGEKSFETEGIGPTPSLAKSPRKLSMKNGILRAWAMAWRTRISASSLRRKLNSMVLVRGLPSLPLVETMKRLSLARRAESEIVRPENGL